MFGRPSSQELVAQVNRPDRVREASNDLYIFEYKSSRSKSKKNKWDLTDTKYEKSATYLLKKEQLRQKINQANEPNTQMDHRSNIDRLYSLISRSRTFIKNDDSGCQKLVRAISRLLDKPSIVVLKQGPKLGFEALKRYTMTCSSSNYELFIQSKHNLKETIKVKPSDKKLQQISQNVQQNGFNGELSRTNRQLEKDARQSTENKDNSISFQNMDNHQAFKIVSRGNITTQEDLSFECQFSPLKGHFVQTLTTSAAKTICPSLNKAHQNFSDSQKHLIHIFSQNNRETYRSCQALSINSLIRSEPLEIQRQSDEIGLMFSQVAFLFTKKQAQEKEKAESKASGKCPSPIYNLLYAIPISSVTAAIETQAIQKNQPIKRSEAMKSSNQSRLFKKQQKKDGILTANQYAARMLFGQPTAQQAKIAEKTIRNPLMHENTRKRISSLPKITFTYTSRQKYELEASPEMKQSAFPITVYNQQIREPTIKESSCKNTSKGDIKTNFSSKPATVSRNNLRFPGQNPQENQYNTPGVIRNPIRHHKIAVSPRQHDQYTMKSSVNQNVFGAPQGVRNEYYGDNQNLKQFDMMSQAMDRRRQRVLTAQPEWQNDVQFVAVQRQLPLCCWQGKETRSRSLNDRLLQGNRYQFQT